MDSIIELGMTRLDVSLSMLEEGLDKETGKAKNIRAHILS